MNPLRRYCGNILFFILLDIDFFPYNKYTIWQFRTPYPHRPVELSPNATKIIRNIYNIYIPLTFMRVMVLNFPQ